MESRSRSLVVWVAVFAIVIGLRTVQADDGKSFGQANRPDNLKTLLGRIHRTMYEEKDMKKAVTLFRSLVPDRESVKAALRDEVPPDAVDKVLAMYGELAVNEADLRRMITEDQSDVSLFGASTEEIAKYSADSIPFLEFPGGTRRVAERYLRPGMLFYEAVFHAPRNRSGMKFHLFFWDGRRWAMLGPVWRVLDGKSSGR